MGALWEICPDDHVSTMAGLSLAEEKISSGYKAVAREFGITVDILATTRVGSPSKNEARPKCLNQVNNCGNAYGSRICYR